MAIREESQWVMKKALPEGKAYISKIPFLMS
jgi:hypothetical protein